MSVTWRRSISVLCVVAMLANSHVGTVLTAATRPAKPAAEAEPPSEPVKTCKSCKHCSPKKSDKDHPTPAEKPAPAPDGGIDTPCPCCPMGAACPCAGGCALCSIAKTLCHDAVLTDVAPVNPPGDPVAESSSQYRSPLAESLARPPRV